MFSTVCMYPVKEKKWLAFSSQWFAGTLSRKIVTVQFSTPWASCQEKKLVNKITVQPHPYDCGRNNQIWVNENIWRFSSRFYLCILLQIFEILRLKFLAMGFWKPVLIELLIFWHTPFSECHKTNLQLWVYFHIILRTMQKFIIFSI